MNERDFLYWLKGFVELAPVAVPTDAQWAAIRKHLSLVATTTNLPASTFVGKLIGFVTLNGRENIGPQQWGRIVELLNAEFENITNADTEEVRFNYEFDPEVVRKELEKTLDRWNRPVNWKPVDPTLFCGGYSYPNPQDLGPDGADER